MTFQYFFFDTYLGYFLQALPIALMSGFVYWLIKYKNDKETQLSKKVFTTLFVSYVIGLLCLVLFFDIMISA